MLFTYWKRPDESAGTAKRNTVRGVAQLIFQLFVKESFFSVLVFNVFEVSHNGKAHTSTLRRLTNIRNETLEKKKKNAVRVFCPCPCFEATIVTKR